MIWSHAAFVSALALSLLHSLWQGALIGLLGLALGKRLKQATPDVRCGAFSLLLLTLFLVWLGTFGCEYNAHLQTVTVISNSFTGVMGSQVLTAPAPHADGSPLVALLESISPYLVALWTLGVSVLSLRHIGGYVLLQYLSRTATAICSPAWEECAARFKARMGIRRKILLRCSTRIDVPFAFGLFKSSILLPLHAMTGLAPEQAEALIAHELAHFARHDVLLNFIQVCIETILFYHPVVRWLSTQIRAAREQACDDLAIQVIGDRALYARALFSLEEARASVPQLALGAKGDTSKMTNTQLIRRIHRILGTGGLERRDPWAKGALALGAATLGVAALFPVYAQSPHQGDKTPQTVTLTRSAQASRDTQVLMNINGKKIELDLDTPEITPDTKVKVDGKAGRFGDLPQKLQDELRSSVVIVPSGATVMSGIALDSKGMTKTIRIEKDGDAHGITSTDVLLNINGDQIELGTTDPTADSAVKVNGTVGRFGDLTDKQQKQLHEAVQNITIATVKSLPGTPRNLTLTVIKADGLTWTDQKGQTLTITQDNPGVQTLSLTGVRMNINGDNIELNTTDPTADTPVTVNGTVGRFGDLNAAQQKQISEQLQSGFAVAVKGFPTDPKNVPAVDSSGVGKADLIFNGSVAEFATTNAVSTAQSVPATVVTNTTPAMPITLDLSATGPVQATTNYSSTKPVQAAETFIATKTVPATAIFSSSKAVPAAAIAGRGLVGVEVKGKKGTHNAVQTIRIIPRAPAAPATPSVGTPAAPSIGTPAAPSIGTIDTVATVNTTKR